MAFQRLRPIDLRRAIEGEGLTLHYLPQVRLDSGQLDGVECFVRWPHATIGLVGPGEVSDLVQEGSLHEPFDRWVIRTACAQIGRWRERGVVVPLAAVSLWPATLSVEGAADAILAAVREAGAEPAQLEVKVPRGKLPDPTLASVARAGVRLATDEPREFEAPGVRTIKVRPEAVKDVAANAGAIMAAIEAARRSGARVVAEGVETQEQEDALRGLGVDVAQGYLYSPEVSAEEVAALVTTAR